LAIRVGRVRDPHGNIWWLQTHVADIPVAHMSDPVTSKAMQHVQQSVAVKLAAGARPFVHTHRLRRALPA
jgi:hypothetical protein